MAKKEETSGVDQKTIAKARKNGLLYKPTHAGEHITGIPAQSLYPEDVAQLSDEQITACLSIAKLYDVSTKVMVKEIQAEERES